MTSTSSIQTLAPLVVLGVVLVLLLFFAIPSPNKEIAMTIVAGLLGYLSKGERAPTTTVTTGSPPDQTAITTEPQP